jgi:hypothetical protein
MPRSVFTFVVNDDCITDEEVFEQLVKQGQKALKLPEKKKALSAVVSANAYMNEWHNPAQRLERIIVLR